LAAVILLLILLRSRGDESPSTPPASPAAWLLQVNAEAGYSFSHPPSWELTGTGTTSNVTSPDMAAMVSFGLGAAGNLEDASGRFVSSLEGTYPDLVISGTVESEIAGSPANTATAEATNEAGVRIVILAITVAAPDRNYAISAFIAADVGSELTQVVEEIVASFRPPNGSPA
jgi:hypothetical protein